MNLQNKSTSKIGIVIPIYNVAKYLRECLDSVANQTYENFCAVLVNDGSCDDSLQIALDYVAKDSRFVLIDKKNGGQSSARNAGIDYFGGDNLFWGMQFRTCKNFWDFADFKSSLNPKNSYKYKSHTAITSIVDSTQSVESSEKIKAKKPYKSFCYFWLSPKVESPLPLNLPARQTQNLTLYHNPESTPNPPKIDYIIFLDSDDFWESDLLEKCVESVQIASEKGDNPDIIWFDHTIFYDDDMIEGGGTATNRHRICVHSLKTSAIPPRKLSHFKTYSKTPKSAKSLHFGGRGKELSHLSYCVA